jgi:hypothetical protein
MMGTSKLFILQSYEIDSGPGLQKAVHMMKDIGTATVQPATSSYLPLNFTHAYRFRVIVFFIARHIL